MSIKTKADRLMIAKIDRIFILLEIDLNLLSYHIQQAIINEIPKMGANQNINSLNGFILAVSLVRSLAASEIG